MFNLIIDYLCSSPDVSTTGVTKGRTTWRLGGSSGKKWDYEELRKCGASLRNTFRKLQYMYYRLFGGRGGFEFLRKIM